MSCRHPRQRGGGELGLGRGALTLAATTALAVTAVALPVAATSEPAPATGHAQVVAQALIEFGPGAYRWTLAAMPVDTDGMEIVADAPTFLIADGGGGVLLTGSDGTRLRLAGGEAAFRYTDTSTNVHNAGDAPATLLAIDLGAADAGTAALTPGAGLHDVDLVRDVLVTGETLTLDAPVGAFVVVTAGTVTDTAGQPLAMGDTTTGAGPLTFRNDGEQTAVVLAAVIGSAVDHQALAPTPPPVASGDAPAGEASDGASGDEPADPTSATTDGTAPSAGGSGETTESTGPDVASGPAPPPASTVTVDFSPRSPARAGSVNVTGSGCNPGEYVEVITFQTVDSASSTAGITADGSGAFATSIGIDGSIPPGAEFQVVAACGGYPAEIGRSAVAYGTVAAVEPITDPSADTDGDGIADGDEIARGLDPLIPDT